MFNDLSKDPDEEHAWSRAQSDCIAYQQKHGSLTIEATSQAMQTALAMLESHNGRQRNRGKKRPSPKKDDIKIKALVTELVRKETKKFGSQRNSSANGKEEQEKIHCTICGKTHVGGAAKCRKKRDTGQTRANKKKEITALKFMSKINEEDAEQDESESGAEGEDEIVPARSTRRKKNKANNSYSRAASVVLAHPDTQAQMSVTNKPEFVKAFNGSQVTLVGIKKGSGIPAHIARLSFVLQAENNSTYTLETEGVYSQDASAVVLSHDSMRRAGLVVDYDEGRISTPDGQTI
jgi:hypothetical protein